MYKLIRFYNQNRRKILIIILIIAFFFFILRVLNSIEKNKAPMYAEKNTTFENIPNSVTSNKSLITGGNLDSEDILKTTNIEKFLNYCKDYDIDNAYNLVSESCKEQLYKTKEEFKEKYVNILFNNKNCLYTIDNWYYDTYKINITENILSTGKKANYSNQDYITVIEEEGEQKLNINGFIAKKNLKSEKDYKGINIKIQNRFQYMNYTIFDLEVTNNNDTIIILDDLKNIDNVYIQDTNSAKYYLYTHEISKEQLEVSANSTKKLSLKFYSKNILSKTIKKLIFNKVILNYGSIGDEQECEYSINI